MADGKEMALRAASQAITARARADYDPHQVELIRATVAAECNPAEFGMFLELCARYQLDPFAKQIWAAKIGGRVAIIVSRDGLLSIANRHDDFSGMDGDVVRRADHFKVVRRAGEIDVEHIYEHAPDADRGDIVGAWAMVYRDGRKPTYFYAPFSEYRGENVWKKQPSAMILKCAESMALRKAYSVTGVVGDAELELPNGSHDLTAAAPQPDYGADEGVAGRLRMLFDALEYTERKRLVVLHGLDDEGRAALLAQLQEEAEARGIDPPDLEPVEGEVVS